MTTKELVIAFLLWWGAQLTASSLLYMRIMGGDAYSPVRIGVLAAGIGLLAVAVVVWKKWEE